MATTRKLMTAFRDQFGCFVNVSKIKTSSESATSVCNIKPIHEDNSHWSLQEDSKGSVSAFRILQANQRISWVWQTRRHVVGNLETTGTFPGIYVQ